MIFLLTNLRGKEAQMVSIPQKSSTPFTDFMI
jgi:hypothetical protein